MDETLLVHKTGWLWKEYRFSSVFSDSWVCKTGLEASQDIENYVSLVTETPETGCKERYPVIWALLSGGPHKCNTRAL